MSAVFDIPTGTDPFALFDEWLASASTQEINDPNAMALATLDADGRIAQRMVLLKNRDMQGFHFYTNFNSRKGRALSQNKQASLLFHWKTLRRQIRIEGTVTQVTQIQADDYFASRPRARQIGAWASLQSQILASKAVLQKAVQELTHKYEGETVPRPPHWSGYVLQPDYMELWYDGADRLHDRFAFTLMTGKKPSDGGTAWQMERLYP